jgi:ammonium transporter, Amt family
MEAPVQDLFTVNNLWMMISTLLIFIMHLGFATLEAGLTRAKNTVNILFKNTIIPALGLLTYAFVGFNLMYPGADFAGAFFGFSGFGLSLPEDGTPAITMQATPISPTLSFKPCLLLLLLPSYQEQLPNE